MREELEFFPNSAYLITDVFNRRYYSSLDCDEGYMLLLQDKYYYFADARYFYALQQKLKNTKVVPFLFTSYQDIKKVLQKEGVKTLYLDFDSVTLSEYQVYKKLCSQIKNGTKFLQQARVVKSEKEIESIEKACLIAKQAFEHVLPFIKSGVTETSIKNRLERFMKKRGAQRPSFNTIVAFGKNSAVPHHETGKTKLEKNQAVLMDFGCVVNGYSSDITRTVFYGKPSEEFVKTFNLVATANLLVENAVKPNMPTKQADKIARDYFKENGVDKHFTHSLGHGVGLEIHESPRLSQKSDQVIKEQMVFTIEPGLYYNGEFGVRIENTVVIINGMAVSLTGNGRELITIE